MNFLPSPSLPFLLYDCSIPDNIFNILNRFIIEYRWIMLGLYIKPILNSYRGNPNSFKTSLPLLEIKPIHFDFWFQKLRWQDFYPLPLRWQVYYINLCSILAFRQFYLKTKSETSFSEGNIQWSNFVKKPRQLLVNSCVLIFYNIYSIVNFVR